MNHVIWTRVISEVHATDFPHIGSGANTCSNSHTLSHKKHLQCKCVFYTHTQTTYIEKKQTSRQSEKKNLLLKKKGKNSMVVDGWMAKTHSAAYLLYSVSYHLYTFSDSTVHYISCTLIFILFILKCSFAFCTTACFKSDQSQHSRYRSIFFQHIFSSLPDYLKILSCH